ncbi:MAG: hypothetical protein QNK19_15515 [Xanthomonadales bacterium]|nr:hypothetical protein [Xanthomonadales bacterium]
MFKTILATHDSVAKKMKEKEEEKDKRKKTPMFITPEADNIAEGDEVLDITIAENAAYVIGSPVSASMTIEDFIELMFSDGFE